MSLSYWFSLIQQEGELLESPKERLEVYERLLDKLLSKTSSVPSTPEESVSNVTSALDAIESKKVQEALAVETVKADATVDRNHA